MYRGLEMRGIMAGWIESQVAGAERAKGSKTGEIGAGPCEALLVGLRILTFSL